MIQDSNGNFLVQDVSELPYQGRGSVTHLYADFETTSGSPDRRSVNPWHYCYPLGIAVKVDQELESYYVPINHADSHWNLPADAVQRWWRDLLSRSERWVNQNVKYDAHVSANGMRCPYDGVLVDLLTIAKIIDSDRIDYSLTALALTYLERDVSAYEARLKAALPIRSGNKKSQDYGECPADIMAEYACVDVDVAQALHGRFAMLLPDECQEVIQTEIAITSVLVDLERHGLRIDPQFLRVEETKVVLELLQLDQRLKDLTGRPVLPTSPDSCYDVLINQYGLPVLAWNTDQDDVPTSPSFDKAAMEAYRSHVDAPVEVIDAMSKYRTLSTFRSLFLVPYQELHVDGMLHSTYNQCIRTGRMSCSAPNATQLNKRAKNLVYPDNEDHAFLSIDYSQIEFRLIVHYIKALHAIEAYNANPDTDFHTWVAELCGVNRSAAKNLNFAIGYGAGRKKTMAMLLSNREVLDTLTEERGSPEWVETATRRAGLIYQTYHDRLSTLKQVSRRAGETARQRGYVRNLYGRHRRLPERRAHIAFNTLCQSSAADLMKERVVAASEYVAGSGVTLRALVHDEILFHGPKPVLQDAEFVTGLVRLLETPRVELRIPIRCKMGYSDKTWGLAGSDETKPFKNEMTVEQYVATSCR
jgi:DNA polymerase I